MQYDLEQMLLPSRILVLENDPTLRDLILGCFTQKGYERLEVVESGRLTVQKILEAKSSDDPFELLVMELNLDDVSGRDLFGRLRTILDIPIVLVSNCYDAGIDYPWPKDSSLSDFFSVPLDLEVFLLRSERLLARRLFNRRMGENVRHNQKMFLNVLQVMAKVLETKDSYTMFHSENVAKYARKLARRFGFSHEKLEMIKVAGILHDFGKIGVNDTILNKPGALTDEEYSMIRRHPLIGSMILEPIDELGEIIADIRYHHERFDGKGYPDNISGEKIPLGARILCVADSFDAMTSNRSHHRAERRPH